MAKLGLGPGGDNDPAKFPPDILAAINKGIAEGHQEIVDGAAVAVDSSKFTARANSWKRDTWTARSA